MSEHVGYDQIQPELRFVLLDSLSLNKPQKSSPVISSLFNPCP